MTGNGRATGTMPSQPTGRWRDHFETLNTTLIPPLSEDFPQLGDPETTGKAREWALNWRLQLADGVYPCAHGFLLMSCPAMLTGGCGVAGFLDHARIWVPYDDPHEPFLLAHLYRDAIPAEAHAYARAHGLVVESFESDGWYGNGTLPVRLTVGCTGTIPWPLGTRAIVMRTAYPVRWPDDVERAALSAWVAGERP